LKGKYSSLMRENESRELGDVGIRLLRTCFGEIQEA
jgi:hypothetical protein